MDENRIRPTMSVRYMARLLGIGKTDSYWLIHKGLFETTLFKGHIRIYRDSFESWYDGQLWYRKVDGPPPSLAGKWDMSIEELAKELGLTDAAARRVIREQKCLSSEVINGKVFINRAEFEEWYARQFRYRKALGEPPGQAYPESISAREMCEMLGIRLRNTGYCLTKKGVFNTFVAEGQLRVDVLSFEKWYRGQNHYKKVRNDVGGRINGIYCEEEE